MKEVDFVSILNKQTQFWLSSHATA